MVLSVLGSCVAVESFMVFCGIVVVNLLLWAGVPLASGMLSDVVNFGNFNFICCFLWCVVSSSSCCVLCLFSSVVFFCRIGSSWSVCICKKENVTDSKNK